MGFDFGIRAIQPLATASRPHILGFATPRSIADDTLFEVWNGATSGALRTKVDLDGRLSLGDGTLAKPGVRFLDDPDSGVYRIGDDNIGVAVGGAKILDVAAAGVGVTGTLHATGAVDFDSTLNVDGNVSVAGTTVITSGLVLQGVQANANILTSGTLHDDRFPATLPAVSGANLTNLNANNLASGTVPDGRFPATLPAASGANLTALNAGNLASGTIPDARFPATLPAVSGANLTNLDASNLASGTIPDARFPATLPAISGANLTNLDASDLASGTIPSARVSGSYTGITAVGTLSSLTVGGLLTLDRAGTDPLITFAISGSPVASLTHAAGSVTLATTPSSLEIGDDATLSSSNSAIVIGETVVLGNVTSKLAFFGGSGTTKQTVSGSTGANAALQSLLSALQAYGLVTDSTT